MHKLRQFIPTLFLLPLLAFVFTGCSSDNPTAPLANFQPEIVNNQDSFQFQATAVENVSATVSYSWQNSGTQATINHSSTVDSGSVSVIILDNDGVQVYGNPLAASLNEPTSTGIAGTWTVRVTLLNCYGTLNFRAETL
jgi:PBP1b-binding outer membrane lipoprotein LpoB